MHTKAAIEHRDAGLIHHADGEDVQAICNAIALKKPDGSVRWIGDFRPLNEDTADSPWPLRDVQQNLSRIKGKVFALLDLLAGFHQIELSEASRKYCGLHTPLGVMVWSRMAFGLKGAPATFAKLVLQLNSYFDKAGFPL